MARYFIVTPESSLHKDYFAWKENLKQVDNHVQKFMSDYGITSRVYYPSQDFLYIEPTPEDLEKFDKVLGKDIGNGLRRFKQNSRIGKAWIQSLEENRLKVLRKPSPIFYFEGVYGRYKTRLFDANGTVYCSIDPNPLGECPVGMQEIKASEFYRILEECAAANSSGK